MELLRPPLILSPIPPLHETPFSELRLSYIHITACALWHGGSNDLNCSSCRSGTYRARHFEPVRFALIRFALEGLCPKVARSLNLQ